MRRLTLCQRLTFCRVDVVSGRRFVSQPKLVTENKLKDRFLENFFQRLKVIKLIFFVTDALPK
jgi:hypothetical protein